MDTKHCLEPEVEYRIIPLTPEGDSLCGYVHNGEEFEKNVWWHGPCCGGRLEIVAVTKIHDRLTCQNDGCDFAVFFPNRIKEFGELRQYFAGRIPQIPPPRE